MSNISRSLGRRREKFIDKFLTQTYRIFPPDYEETDEGGNVTLVESDPLRWRGFEDIPCKVDLSRYISTQPVFGQETTISGYEIVVPFDAPLESDHTIRIGDTEYQVRRLFTDASDALFKSALINEVD